MITYHFGQNPEALPVQKSDLYHQKVQDISYATQEYHQKQESFVTPQKLGIVTHVPALLENFKSYKFDGKNN